MKPVIDLSEGDLNLSDARRHWRQTCSETSRHWLERDEAVFIHQSLSTPCLEYLDQAVGSYIGNSDRQWLDFHGNSLHQAGYGHPHIVAAIEKALRDLPFSPRRFTNAYSIKLAERLTHLAPGNLNRLLFTTAGTTAVSTALKMARLCTGKHRIISFRDSFHGASLDAISAGGEKMFRQGLGPLMPGTIHLPAPGGQDFMSPRQIIDYFEYITEHETDLAAFIAEPVRCTTVRPVPDYFWPAIKSICERQGILLIFDEIPTCLGRTGTLFASEQTGVTPDLMVIGKGLGGGILPLAAVLAADHLNIPPESSLGHYTHEKSPVCAAAANALLDLLEAPDFFCHMTKRANQLFSGLNGLVNKFPDLCREARAIGMAFALELHRSETAEAILYHSLANGLSYKVSAGKVLTLMPPLTISETEITQALSILEQALTQMATPQPPTPRSAYATHP